MRTTRENWLLCAAAAAVCAALNWLLLRRAVWMAPDSWAFWQGSVSILDGRGYRLFVHNEPVKEWPPLYSVYLAAWQAAFGVSGKVLIAAQSGLAGLSALTWMRLSLALMERARTADARAAVARYAQAFFVSLFIATRYDCIRADNLKYVMLPVLIATSERAWLARTRATLLRQCAALGGLGMLLMLTHTSSLAFVGAALVVVLFARQLPMATRLLGGALSTSLALIPWLFFRYFLEQTGSHRVGLGVAAYHVHNYAVQALGGSTTLLIRQPWLSAPFTALVIGVTYCGLARRALSERTWLKVRVRLVFIASALLILFLLFNVTYITDKLTGRFLFFVPLTLIPLALALLASGKRPALSYATTALILLAGIPRLLDVLGGVQASREGRAALPKQLAFATDCVRRPDASPAWACSPGTTPRLPPPDPDWSRR